MLSFPLAISLFYVSQVKLAFIFKDNNVANNSREPTGRCPRMSLVHLAITTLVALAGLSTLQPHVPPAICPYSQEDMSCKHLLYHAYSSISELVKLGDVDVTYCLVL